MTTRSCPYCAEQIQAAAVICKHCQRAVEPLEVAPTIGTVKPGKRATPASAYWFGGAVLLVVGLLGLDRGGSDGFSSLLVAGGVVLFLIGAIVTGINASKD